tara:strand:+ start:13125 stop:14261 length:1137 start_codon:yes stop_codon:yes gene_type:complete
MPAAHRQIVQKKSHRSPCEFRPLTNATICDAVREALDAGGPEHAHPVYGPIADWDVSRVTDMRGRFMAAKAFNGDLSRWDVRNVEDMRAMFWGATAFNADLSGWNVRNVTTMDGMFHGAAAFNADLSRWDVRNVTNMHSMFSGAAAFNSDLSGWNVSNVTHMGDMFWNATAFNGDLSDWDVRNVTTMDGTFHGAAAFNADLSRWDVRNVTGMSFMFSNATAFNSDLSGWHVCSVTAMRGMFCRTKAFNCDLSGWDVSNLKGAFASRRMFRTAFAFGEALPPKLMERLRADDPKFFSRNGRWLWRLARRLVRPHARTRTITYYWMHLAARPDAAGNAPRGAVEAFRDDFCLDKSRLARRSKRFELRTPTAKTHSSTTRP